MVRLLFLLPLLILIVDFALSNQAPVRLGLWPTGLNLPLPLSVAVLLIGGLCFILGAGVTWAGRIAANARASLAERTVAQLRAQLAARPVAVPAPTTTAPALTAPIATAPGSSLALTR